mmetsp:Transcript_27020/g.41157  ORF Transcript_27020/g.41157 Transcript_27020/m.41157 type:complete len:157 (-) Transcript_27020:183-653(-)
MVDETQDTWAHIHSVFQIYGNEFQKAPCNEVTFLQFMVSYKDILAKVGYLKNLYTNIPVDKLLTPEELKSKDLKKVKLEYMEKVRFLSASGYFGPRGSVKLDEKNMAVEFEDIEVQEALVNTTDQSMAIHEKKEAMVMKEIIEKIESHTLRLVDSL